MKIYLSIIYIFFVCNSYAQKFSLGAEQIISENGTGNYWPRIANTSEQSYIVIWGNGATKEIYSKTFKANVASTTYKVNTEGIKPFITDWASTELAANGNTVFVTYKADPANTGKIYILKSTDGGLSFGKQVSVVDPVGFNSRFSVITTDANANPVLGYMRFNTSFGDAHYVGMKSNDAGNSFGNFFPITDTNKGESCDCCPGTFVRDGNDIAFLYRNNENNVRNMYMALSSNGGNSFDQVIDLDVDKWTIHACPASGGDAHFSADAIYTVWMSGKKTNNKVYLTKLNRQSLEKEFIVQMNHTSSTNLAQNFPRIAGNGDTIGIVWKEYIINDDVFFTYTLRGDTSDFRKNAVRLHVNNGGIQENPDIIYLDQKFVMVWQDNQSGKIMQRIADFVPVSSNQDVEQNPITVIQTRPGYAVINSPDWEIQSLYNMEILPIPFKVGQNGDFTVHNKVPGVYIIQLSQGKLRRTVKTVLY